MLRRTYSRKRPQNLLIDNVLELCRLCLKKSKEMVSLFVNNTDHVYAVLPIRVMLCIGIEVVKDKNLPNSICVKCYNDLENFYTFKKKCEDSFQKLKSHLIALELAEANASINETANRNLVTLTEEKTIESKDACKPAEQSIEKVDYSENPGQIVLFTKSDNDNILAAPDENLSKFLKKIVKQLSIIRPGYGGFGKNGDIRVVELLCGDDKNLTYDIVEEDTHVEISQSKSKTYTQLQQNRDNMEVNSDVESKGQGPPVNKIISPYSNNSASLLKRNVAGGGRQCFCGRVCASASSLARHLVRHSGEKPFRCSTCSLAFTQNVSLQRHMLLHDGPPHACGACGKRFTQREALAAHSRSHAPPARRALMLHQCTRCPKVFLHASGLTRHAKIHETTEPYRCSVCERPFNDSSALRRHELIHKSKPAPNHRKKIKRESKDDCDNTASGRDSNVVVANISSVASGVITIDSSESTVKSRLNGITSNVNGEFGAHTIRLDVNGAAPKVHSMESCVNVVESNNNSSSGLNTIGSNITIAGPDMTAVETTDSVSDVNILEAKVAINNPINVFIEMPKSYSSCEVNAIIDNTNSTNASTSLIKPSGR